MLIYNTNSRCTDIHAHMRKLPLYDVLEIVLWLENFGCYFFMAIVRGFPLKSTNIYSVLNLGA